MYKAEAVSAKWLWTVTMT